MKIKIIVLLLALFAFSGCEFTKTTRIENDLNVPVEVEIKATTGRVYTETIAPGAGYLVFPAAEARNKCAILSCEIRANGQHWSYSPADIIRLEGNKQRDFQVWTIGPDGLSRKL